MDRSLERLGCCLERGEEGRHKPPPFAFEKNGPTDGSATKSLSLDLSPSWPL